MKIMMVAPEFAPWAKVGGLADVSSALSKALAGAGHPVRVCLPYYDSGKALPAAPAGTEKVFDIDLPLRPARRVRIRVRPAPKPLDAFVLVEAPGLFDRPGIYGDPATGQGYPDNGERFVAFSAAAAAVVARRLDGFVPEIVHCHDHQSGLVPAFLRHGGAGVRAEHPVATVFTIHNLGYQGVYSQELFARTGLDAGLMRPLGALEFHGRMNLMKAGIALSDRITAVSPTYAEEICTEDYGEKLEGLLRERRRALVGILNGVDVEVWNPETDPLIPTRYTFKGITNKAKNRIALLEAFNLSEAPAGVPVIGIVSRLAAQKGFDLVLAGLDRIMKDDLRLVVLGTGDEEYRKGLQEASRRHPDRVGVKIGFDEKIAHLIEAGSDMFLMPSKYEPCGLNQMYSLRYGTIPVVRATGGLADTVVDLDEDPDQANGFVFRLYQTVELVKTVRRAVRAYKDRKLWKELVRRGMETDFSWDRSAARYLEVYRAAAAEARTAA